MNLNNIDISKLPADVRKELLQLQVMAAEKKIKNRAKDDFMSFVKAVWPEFIEGPHHRVRWRSFAQPTPTPAHQRLPKPVRRRPDALANFGRLC